MAQFDIRLVLFAVLIAAAATFTAFEAHARSRDAQGRRRVIWLLLAGTSAGAGIWSTHFLSVRVYDWLAPTSYDPILVAAALIVAVVATTAGFALATPDGRWQAAAGGAVIGAGIVATHVVGLHALSLPGTLERYALTAVPIHVAAVALCCLALPLHRELGRRGAIWVATAAMTLAICGLHLAATGAMTVVPDPTIVVPVSNVSGTTLAIAVACTTALMMAAAHVATLASGRSARDAERDLRARHDTLRQREEEVSRHNMRISTVLANMPHGVSMVDPDRRLVVCNARYAEMYGLPGELTRPGTPIADVLEHRIANDIYAGPDAEAYRAERLAPLIEPSIKTYSLSGGRTVLVTRQPTADGGWVAIHEDITERMRLEETEREAKETLAAVFDAVPAAIVCADTDGRVVLWSRGAEHIFGYTAEETVGEAYKLVPPGQDVEFSALFTRALAGEILRDIQVQRRRKDGALVDVSFSCAPMYESDGSVRGIVYALDDITERERLNARLKAQNDLLSESQEQLTTQNEQLDAALGNMVQGLAMFDAAERLVLANERYAELHGHPPGEIKPGMRLREIVELRMARGLYAGLDVEQVLNGMRARVGSERQRDLISRPGNGRVLSLSTQPLSAGGWVVTLHDISEQEQLKKQLEAQNERLDAALNNMSQGLAMFDADQRLVVCNKLYGEMYGLTMEQLPPGTTVRQTLEYRYANGCYDEADPGYIDELVDSFGTRPTAIHRLADGRLIHVTYRRTTSGGHVVTHEDITAREKLSAQLEQQNRLLKQHEAQLQARNVQLDATINNMVQGLAMFDGDHRLIVCNKLYAEMYGLTPEQVKPGTTVREIFQHRLANGSYHTKDTEGFVDSWVGGFGQQSTRTQELADGRIISVSRALTVDGGRVVTHEDITARQRLNAQLEQQHRLVKAHEEKLQAQNLQLDAALNNMVQGLAMFDAEQRIVIANHRYAEMYGLTLELVKPGTHLLTIIERRIANGDLPGWTAEEVMRAMLGRVTGTGECQYTTRLSDGRYIVVSAKPMANGYTVTTHQDVTEQRRSEAKIVHMAMHDALTGLPNRVLFSERIEHALARLKGGDIVATHLLDLDHFKNVNDTLGHPTGDKLLKAVTDRLRLLVRDTDTIARMGGDEFAILQVAAQPADATALARRVIDAITEPYDIDGHHVVIGTSVGIAVGPADGLSPDRLLRNADLALYRAKGEGRGTFAFFEPGMDAQMQERRAMEHDLRKALTAGEFELYYQPVVNLQTDRISGFEALLRWRHPEKGLVSPAMFIPLAEEIGFIVPLGDWAIRQACARAARWPGNVKIAVNLSPVQFCSPGLVQTVVGALAASGLSPDRLELEITETVLLQDSEATLAMLYQLREFGVRIAMDDFGTGYSSLSYLQSFPFDRIKIDQSFIKDITDGTGSATIVRAVAALAIGLGMETTAEGVETPEQREAVKAEGCTEMQGYLFSRPRPAEEIEQLYFPCLASQPAEPPPAFEASDPTPPIAARAAAQ